MSRAKPYLLVLLGSSILSFGLYNVHSQSGITEGGVLGMVLFLEHWFHISPSVSNLLLDGSCYLLGFRVLGWSFLRYAAVATVSFSLTYRVWESFPPLLPDLSGMPLVAAVLGALFVGLGVGLVVRIGGACGGDDALALVISRISGLPIARAYLFTDLLVLGLSLSYIPVSKILCSLVTVILSSWLIGRVQNWGRGKETPPEPAADPQ